MPKLDGFDVLRWIRKQPALKELPVVVLSGSDEPSDIKRAKELGAMSFLTKYPPAAVFAEVIAKAMRDC
jgi:CheY-like chemotaxis protein